MQVQDNSKVIGLKLVSTSTSWLEIMWHVITSMVARERKRHQIRVRERGRGNVDLASHPSNTTQSQPTLSFTALQDALIHYISRGVIWAYGNCSFVWEAAEQQWKCKKACPEPAGKSMLCLFSEVILESCPHLLFLRCTVWCTVS